MTRYVAGWLLLLPLGAFAQDANGIAPAWDMRATLAQLAGQADRYRQAAAELKLDDWLAKGASPGYRSQQQAVQREAEYLKLVGSRLAANPEKLSLALDAFFRLQTLETVLVSLSEGAARYQGQQVAQAMGALVTENAVTRGKLRQYVMDLSVSQEQEQAVALKEAQRCMTILSRPAPEIPSNKPPRQERP